VTSFGNFQEGYLSVGILYVLLNPIEPEGLHLQDVDAMKKERPRSDNMMTDMSPRFVAETPTYHADLYNAIRTTQEQVMRQL
jgi:hypothetical protein